MGRAGKLAYGDVLRCGDRDCDSITAERWHAVGIATELLRSTFSTLGASGTVKFLPTGDRQLPPAIVSVQQRDDKWLFGTPQPQT